MNSTSDWMYLPLIKADFLNFFCRRYLAVLLSKIENKTNIAEKMRWNGRIDNGYKQCEKIGSREFCFPVKNDRYGTLTAAAAARS